MTTLVPSEVLHSYATGTGFTADLQHHLGTTSAGALMPEQKWGRCIHEVLQDDAAGAPQERRFVWLGWPTIVPAEPVARNYVIVLVEDPLEKELGRPNPLVSLYQEDDTMNSGGVVCGTIAVEPPRKLLAKRRIRIRLADIPRKEPDVFIPDELDELPEDLL